MKVHARCLQPCTNDDLNLLLLSTAPTTNYAYRETQGRDCVICQGQLHKD